MRKSIFTLFLFSLITLISCSDESSTPSGNLQSDIIGIWTVTRTLVSGSTDFPNGYQDQQAWKFTKSGDVVTLTTSVGSVNGVWKSTTTYASAHWVFDTSFTDPSTGMNYRILVEIIGVNPLKGTNESYIQDIYTGAWTLLDAFSIVGVRQ